MFFTNLLAVPLNILSCGALQRLQHKEIQKEDVLGVNTQNILGQIPFYNFYVGSGRINRSYTYLKQFKSEKSLSNTDKSELQSARGHLARGVIELIPGAGLLFLLPDILFSLVKKVMAYLKDRNDPNGKLIRMLENKLEETQDIVKSIERNYNRWPTAEESAKNRCKADVKELITNYVNGIEKCDELIQQLNKGTQKDGFINTLTRLKDSKLLTHVLPLHENDIDKFLDPIMPNA